MSDELLSEFIYDSLDHLGTAGAQLLHLEKESDSLVALNALMGTLHSIKGNSGFLGLQNLYNLLHNAESLLQTIRDTRCPCPPQIINLLLQVLDTMEALLSRLKNGQDDTVEWLDELTKSLSEAETRLENSTNTKPDPPAPIQPPISAAASQPLPPAEPSDFVISENLSGKINLTVLKDGQLASDADMFSAKTQAMFNAGLKGMVINLLDLTQISGQELKVLSAVNQKNPDKTVFILNKEGKDSLYRIFQILNLDKTLHLFSNKEQAVAYIWNPEL